MTSTAAVSQKSTTPLRGTVRAPGDKSVSHRAMIFGAMATGTTTVAGLLEGADIMSTADAMRAFGADITKDKDGVWHVVGCKDGFQSPKHAVDCGNAGTGVRLIMGAAAGYKVSATFTGDASLTSRPMGRVLDPLREMGAAFDVAPGDRLPVTLKAGAALTAIDYTPPHASAQVKSCILLAGLNAAGTTAITEPTLTRDHTENMLKAFGVKLTAAKRGDGQVVRMDGGQTLKATHVIVPGDPSSAAFLIVAALITPGSDIIIENVMMNPTRTGLFETLTEMGGYLRSDNFRTSGGEIIADIHVKHSPLHGVTVPPHRAPAMIDEYPILAVAAAFAKGRTVMDGIGELRVKESDRIAATEALLSSNGVNITSHESGMTVIGGDTPRGGAVVKTHHDHRIAMSALILGLGCDAPVRIDDASMIATSFPSFFDIMTRLGAVIETSA
ncbi:3-phosphoshikimate 1-carboxyvinyltransferase [Fretibacter rubidus]|uniref:3-phosphoshikimate 1-carboxyvinyltransferase n=1 Tax=Fretibacter rubidus TaxID=570162 RepID=UPI00352A9983